MTRPIHARGLVLALELPYRNHVLKLKSEIVQVRLRSIDVARQLSSATCTPSLGFQTLSSRQRLYHPALRRKAVYSAVGARRYFTPERPVIKEESGITRAPPASNDKEIELHESPYTIPNALTLARLIACPFLGYTIVQGDFAWATGILVVSGFTDWLDGYIARRFNSYSVLGSILDPAADKALMTTLVGTLAWSGLLPLPLAILIFGRDFGLSLSAFYFRFISLPKPRTLKRYFDVSMPSAEVKPTQISKINTALQLLLMGVTTISPLLSFSIAAPLQALQWTVAGTTIWSGLSYIGRGGVKILKQPGKTVR